MPRPPRGSPLVDIFPRTTLSGPVADQLIGMIYRNNKRVIAPILISTLLCCVLLADAVSTRSLATWFLVSFAASVARVLVLSRIVRWHDAEPTAKLSVLAALSFVTGSVYASILVFFPGIDAFERAMLTAMLISFCSGAVITNSGYRPVFLSFVSPILGTLAVLWMLNPGEPIGDGLALFIGATIVMMIVTLVAIAQDTFDAFSISAEWSVRQARLTAELSDALAETETARAEAVTSSESKTRFLAAASHDLRQPVHVLSLYGAVLASADVDPKARRIIGKMNLAVESLSSQLSTLLDLSRLDSGDVRAEPRVVDLAALAHELVAEFGEVAASRGIALVNAVEPPLHVRTDPDMLSRILRNLCGNALKYTVDGSVTLSVRTGEDSVTLAIADTGIGIPEEDRERIFEEFYQVSDEGRDSGTGLGLGLSIVQRLVDTLGHRIEVSSRPGEGTTMSLRMARCHVEPSATPGVGRGDGPRSEVWVPTLPEGLWVHVVDDDAAVRDGTRALLQQHGCRVTLTDGAASTLAFLREASPAVLLVDMRLGGEASGVEVIASIRTSHPGLPAALITGEDAGETSDGGALAKRFPDVPVLRKPLTEAGLIRAIDELVDEPLALA